MHHFIFRFFIYFSVFCTLITLSFPSPVCADFSVDCDPCEERRTRVAIAVGAATVIALIGGVTYALVGSSSHRRCHSSSSCSWSDYSNHHHHHHHRSSSSSWSSSSSSGWSPSSGYGSFVLDPQIIERGNLPARSKKLPKAFDCKESKNQIAGSFIFNTPSSDKNKIKATAYVKHPGGMVETLGSVMGNGNIHYGPFSEKGSYQFGLNVEGESPLPQTKMSSVEIHVDGLIVERHDFYSSPKQDPAPFEFSLR